MNFEEKHPAEIQFRKMIDEVHAFVDKYESKYLDGDAQETLKIALENIRQKIDALQEEHYFQNAGEDGVPVNMPEEERDLQIELTNLQRKIEHLKLLKC